MVAPESERGSNTQPIRIIEDEQIVDVPIFNEATRMPLPEYSYAQELLTIPIPLENRIAHLIPYIEPVATTHTQYSIAITIGAPVRWVARTAERIGIMPLSGDGGSEKSVCQYRSPALEVLQEEWEWYQAYNELDDQLTETAIAQFVARSPQWVRKTAYELEVYPGRAVKSGRERLTYKKTLIPQLRHILLVFPPAQDWCTKQELIELTGKSWPWIERQLQDADIKIMKRRSEITGSVHEYSAPESREFLVAQARLDETKRAEPIIEAPAKAEVLERGLALIAVAKMVGRSWAWVESRLPYVGVDSREGTDRTSDILDEEIATRLKKLAEEEAADTRLSVAAIAKILGHRPPWVRARLPFTTIMPEEKRENTYVVYKSEVVDQLRTLPEDVITKGPKPKDH